MSDDENVRRFYRLVRDTSRTAYDVLPCGKTIGEFANEIALKKYVQTIKRKRIQATALRVRKRNKKTQETTNESDVDRESVERSPSYHE